MKSGLPFLAIVLLATAPAYCQPVENVKTTIVTFALGGPPEGIRAFHRSGSKILTFAADSGGPGDPIIYEGPRRFVLRETEAAFSAVPETAPLGFTDLPKNADNVLLIATPGDGKNIRLAAFDVATESLKPGDYKFFNFSHSTLEISLGPRKVSLTPGKNEMLKDPAWHAAPLALPIEIRTVTGKTAVPVYSGFWEHYASRRQVMFMFDGKRSGEPIAFMSFHVETPPKQAAGAR